MMMMRETAHGGAAEKQETKQKIGFVCVNDNFLLLLLCFIFVTFSFHFSTEQKKVLPTAINACGWLAGWLVG